MHQNFAEEVCDALKKVGKEWARRHPKGPRLILGEGTILGGGPHWPHVSHQAGYDVDILVGRKDGKERVEALNPQTRKIEKVTCFLDLKDQGHPLYSLELTREMITVISDYSPVSVESDLRRPESREFNTCSVCKTQRSSEALSRPFPIEAPKRTSQNRP